MTLSTLTCLSLHPLPLVTFNVQTPSASSRAMHDHGSFVIHLLRASPHAAHVARAFAGSHTETTITTTTTTNTTINTNAATNTAINTSHSKPWSLLRGPVELHPATGVPLLSAEDSVLARLACTPHTVVQVQDHEIWVGRVVAIEHLAGGAADGADGADGAGEPGLMYQNRRFRRVGAELVAEFMRPGQEVRVEEEEGGEGGQWDEGEEGEEVEGKES